MLSDLFSLAPDLPKRLDRLESNMSQMLEVMQNMDSTLTQLLNEVQGNNVSL